MTIDKLKKLDSLRVGPRLINFVERTEETVLLFGTCQLSRAPVIFTVRWDELVNWLNGEFTQTAFPNLDDGHREFLISGIGPKGWEMMACEEEEL